MKSIHQWRTPSRLRLVDHDDDDRLERFINALRARGHRVSWREGGRYRSLCPGTGHSDHNPSLAFKYDGQKLHVQCFAGCSIESILSPLGWRPHDLYDRPYAARPKQIIVAEFAEYCDPDGAPLPLPVRKVRYGPRKQFAWQHNEAGAWRDGLQGITVGLFGLDRVRRAASVLWVEGEGKVVAAADQGWPALSSAHGSNPSAALIDRFVVTVQRAGVGELIVLPDHDKPGREYARHVLTAAYGHGLAVKLVRLPDLPASGDIVDYFRAGHDADELRRLVAECPHWTPDAEQREQKAHRRHVDAARLRRWRAAKREAKRAAAAKPAPRVVVAKMPCA